MHPKPLDDPPPHASRNAGSAANVQSDGDENLAIDTDLIRLDT